MNNNERIVNMLSKNWVLFSEELPPVDMIIWVTIKSKNWDDHYYVERCEMCMLYESEYYIATRESEISKAYELNQCVAWMPYIEPKPYRRG